MSATRPADMGTPVRILSAVIRVSRQNGRGKGGKSFLAPDDQRTMIERWCAANNAVVPENRWHYETEGRNSGSAKNWENRKGLQEAMREALTGITDGVIVAKVNRFARTHHEGVMAIHELHEKGRLFIAVDEGIDGRNPSSLGAQIILDVYLRIAEAHLAEMTETWARVVEMQIMAGVAHTCPWGYLRCGMNGIEHAPGCGGDDHELHRHLVPDPERAPWVVRMFERRAKGTWSWPQLADWLNAEGVAPAVGGAWSFNSVRNIIQARTYLGELRSGDVVNTTAHEAIVSHDLWERANALRSTAVKRGAMPYPLRGLLRCASCGSRMRGATDDGVRTYRCKAKFSWGCCSWPARVNADDIEALVEGQFHRDYVQRRRWTPQRSTDELDAAVARQRSVEAEFDAWQNDPTTLRMRSVMGEASYQNAMTARLDAIENTRNEVAALEGELLGLSLPAGLAQAWPEMDDDDRRALLALVYPLVVVRPNLRRPLAARSSRWDAEPIADRVRIFDAHDPALPKVDALPGRGGVSAIVPIAV